MNTYAVTLTLVIGEYHKTAFTVVRADSTEQASEMALYLECHSPESANFEDNKRIVYDLNGEMAYKIHSIALVSDDDLAVLEKYHSIFTYDEAEIRTIKS